MKVKHTQNGNVKITLTLEQASHLKTLLNVSHFLIRDEVDESYTEASEAVSGSLYVALDEAGVDRHYA
jgi:hypothetical protein